MEIIQMLVPSSKYSIKCPYNMNPQGITVHNTANDASAKNEVSYMITNNYQVSYHYAVDDVRAVQGVPLDRNAWHAGDGHGFGNMQTIGIEICYSKSGGERFEAAERNAAELIARLMLQYNWGMDKIGTKTINTHQSRSGKYCPHRTLDMGLERFWNIVRQKYSELSGQPVPEVTPQPAAPADDGNSYLVTVTTGALRIRAGAGTNYEITGMITDKGTYTIVETQGDWGRLKSGKGWICLTYTNKGSGSSSTPIQTSQTTNTNNGKTVGSVVTINGVYTSSSSTKKLNPSVKTGTITKIVSGARNPYLLNNGNIGWTNDECIVGGGAAQPTSQPAQSNSKYVLGLYVVTASGLNVRTGAGTGYGAKKVYPRGTRFDTYEIKGNWARTPSGWVCLDYCQLVRKY